VIWSHLIGDDEQPREGGQGLASLDEERFPAPNIMHGVGVQEIRGIGKLRFGTDPTVDTTKPVDNGIVTVYTANTADA
jgi:hypothetical protein